MPPKKLAFSKSSTLHWSTAADESNPSVEKIDHIFTEDYINEVGMDHIFLRNSQYAEAMVTNYFTFVKMGGVMQNNQGDGKMAYISVRIAPKPLRMHWPLINTTMQC